MMFHSEVLDSVFDSLDKAGRHTVSFSILLKTSTLSRNEFLYFFDELERQGIVAHTTDFWGDPQSYTLLVSAEEAKRVCNIC
jgi:hypothetical protein